MSDTGQGDEGPGQGQFFQIPKNLKWFFAAGLAGALILSQYLAHQKNPFPRLIPPGGRIVAVLPLENRSEPSGSHALTDTLRAQVLLGLVSDRRILVSRVATVDSVLRSTGWRGWGRLDPAGAMDAANGVKSSSFVIGTVMPGPGGPVVDLKVVDSKSGHYLGSVRGRMAVGDPDSVVFRLKRAVLGEN